MYLFDKRDFKYFWFISLKIYIGNKYFIFVAVCAVLVKASQIINIYNNISFCNTYWTMNLIINSL